jgi:hypothetical protein
MIYCQHMTNETRITISLPKKEKSRLSNLALRYGFSLPEFAGRILKEISSDIPEESWSEYKNPKSLKTSLSRSLSDYRLGHFRTKL